MTDERDDSRSLQAPGGLSVLVVEDQPDEACLVTEALAGHGFHTARVVATAHAAVAALEHWTPDLIVLDLGLSDADALDVLGVLSRGEHLGIPVMAVTDDSDAERRVLAFELGAKDVVVKPFDLLELGARAVRVVLAHEQLEAVDVVARTLARELSDLSIELDQEVRTVSDVLLAALEARSPVLGAHSRNVGRLVERLASALGLDDVAEQLGIAASCHRIGAVALDDEALAQLLTGHRATEERCAQLTVDILGPHHRLAVAAARFQEPSDAFAQPVDHLVAQLTAVCHTFDHGSRTARGFDASEGLTALQRGLGTGLDVDLVRTFVDSGLAD